MQKAPALQSSMSSNLSLTTGDAVQATDSAPIIAIRHLRYEIGGKTILELPEWNVREHCLILGPSGSGKTTLLHLIAGFLKPTQGQVSVAGQPLDALTPAALDAFRGRHIGVVFQTLHLMAALDVADNLRLAQYLAGLPQDFGRVREVLAELGIQDKANTRPNSLSQGEAQRVAIARAVINRPSLILADEPTSALDDGSCAQVMELLRGRAEECGATLVVATHDNRIKQELDRRLELSRTDREQP